MRKSQNAVSEKYTHQKNHGLKKYAFHKKQNVTWHIIEAYTSTLSCGVIDDPRTRRLRAHRRQTPHANLLRKRICGS